ncbi:MULTISPECIES: hypothetical protein [unclassified Ruegeria]|uniref:hypothetical protein n=1 Tax=unclassified Ruegeria TaxID=2625375 RepID=UPI001487A766|nr:MULTISPECIES: hypothetical protein [unclassified Ruegeria]
MALIFAAPSLRRRDNTDQSSDWAFDLQTAIGKARPGDTIELLPGRYPTPAVIAISGTKTHPITIRGPRRGRAVLDGGKTRDDGRHGGLEPLDGDFAFLKLFGADHIVIENLSFENCWPNAIYLRSCRDVTVRGCSGTGGRYFLYARQTDQKPTKGLVLDGVTWVQDPDHDMWDGRHTWPEVKGKRDHFDASFFNGAMLGAFDIEGQVVVRNCKISHAFNAIRMDIREKRIEGTKKEPRITRNRNVRIHDNSFAFIRDNAVEPEMGAEDWCIYNNRFYNCHAAFSIDGVAMRDFIVLANWVLNDRRPGLIGQDNQGGKVFKFLGPPDKTGNMPPRARKGFWSIFNSAQTRTTYAKKGRTSEWNDRYTLLGLFNAEYPENAGPPREAFDRFEWNDDVEVQDMVCNDPRFPKQYRCEGTKLPGAVKVVQTFDLCDFDRCANHPLGGWNGELPPGEEARDLTSKAFKIKRVDGSELHFKAGLSYGAQPVAAFDLKDL